MRRLKIAIAGCGPCGLAAALFLQRDGHDVTIFDQFDHPSPIGSGLMLQPTGLTVLRELNLADALIASGSKIRRLYGKAGKRAVLNVRYAAVDDDLFGVGIHRASLFDALHSAALADGIMIAGHHKVASSINVDNGRRALLFEGGQVSEPFDLVVDTLGTSSPLANQAQSALPFGALWANLHWPSDGGLENDVLEQRYWRASKMVGVLPIGTPRHAGRPQLAFFWSLRTRDVDHWRATPLSDWRDEILALWPELTPVTNQIQSHDQMTFARYSHRTLQSPVAPGLIHLGDAWHSASPQLGQGANMALLDAFALATALRSARDLETALVDTIAIRRRHVRLYQAITALFTPIYQSDSRVIPAIRDWLIGPVSQIGPVARLQVQLVTGMFGNPLRRLR